jgi:hypothetical protein
MGQLFIKTEEPGDGGKNTFRMEIGNDDGTIPSPAVVMAHMIWVGLDIAKKNGVRDAKQFFHDMIDKEVVLKEETIS